MNELQGTREWRDARAGQVTASRISDVLSKARKGQAESAGRANYRAKLVCEILNGKALEDEYMSYDMRRGIELEPQARAEYEIRTGLIVDVAGFTPHASIPRFGASVDGLVGKDGILQFKCPKTAIHLSWLMRGIVPTEHRAQILAELACFPQRTWEEFVSFEPNLPQHLQIFKARIERSSVEPEIKEIETEVMKFNAEVDEIIAKLPKENADDDLTEVLTESLKAAKK